MSVSYEQSYSYAELLEILSFTHTSLVKKIPQKLMSIFKENALSTYQHHLDKNIPLENQEISSETANLITLISINYWCESQEEKSEIQAILAENEKLHNEHLRKKYNTDNIFNNSKQLAQSKINSSAVENTPTITEPTVTIKESSINTIENSNNSQLPLDTEQLPFYKKILITLKKFLFKNK